MKEATIDANSGNADQQRNGNELPFILLYERNNRKVHCEGQIVARRASIATMKQEPDKGYELLTLQSRRMLFKASDEGL
jgi:hypothetical protein